MVDYYTAYEEYISTTTPERQLFAAVLARAIADLVSDDRTHARSAAQWFEPEEEKDEGITFAIVCEVLDLGSFHLRQITRLLHGERKVIRKFRRYRMI